jgi:hypothetical protein
MQADRFVTLCFLYSGTVLLVQSLTVDRLALEPGALAQLGVALSVLSVGLVRLRNPDAEAGNPTAYGAFAYGMAVLSGLLTAIFVAQLLLV